MKTLQACVLMVLVHVANSATAATFDLETCTWSTGYQVDAIECNAMRENAVRASARDQAERAQRAEAARLEAERQHDAEQRKAEQARAAHEARVAAENEAEITARGARLTRQFREMDAAQTQAAAERAKAQGAPSDITCRDRNGLRINTAPCIAFLKDQRSLTDAQCSDSGSCREAAAARNKARTEYYERLDAERAAAEDRAQAAEDRKARAATDALKARCGADYKNPRIGMSIMRAQECVTPMRVVAQLNRADGVVTTYRGGGGSVFHAMDGLIVGWSK